MSISADKAQGFVILAAGAVALFVAYKVYRTGQDAADSVSETLDEVSEFVGGAVDAVASVPRAAYTEVRNFFNMGPPIGGTPDALSGVGSMADAQRLARDVDKWYEERDAAYDLVKQGGYWYGEADSSYGVSP
jgi:hypothetical protein